MSTSIAIIAKNTGATEAEITTVLTGMIISSKNQHGATATGAEMAVVTGTCAKYGLNPLVREAHAFISGGKLQVVIGIDGWIKIMNRQPDFNGVEFIDNFDGKSLISITTKIHIKGRDFPTCVTEYMDECKQLKSDAWKKYEKRMLRNKSLGQCVRVAFGISEVIDDDEKARIVGGTVENQTHPIEEVDFKSIEQSFAECGDDHALMEAAKEARKNLELSGAWKNAKSDVASMRLKHQHRIDALVVSVDDNAEFIPVSDDLGTFEEPEVSSNNDDIIDADFDAEFDEVK
jgi:hypothetical protein